MRRILMDYENGGRRHSQWFVPSRCPSADGLIPSLEEQEKAYIQWVLDETDGNKTLAAQYLGIDRVSLWRKLEKYGLS
jgi:transcriptional regulator with PAS, ATPase and Fis domain